MEGSRTASRQRSRYRSLKSRSGPDSYRMQELRTGTGGACAPLSEILPAARVARFVRMTQKMPALAFVRMTSSDALLAWSGDKVVLAVQGPFPDLSGPRLRAHQSRNFQLSKPSRWRTRTRARTSGAISRAFTPMRSRVLSTAVQWVTQPQFLQR